MGFVNEYTDSSNSYINIKGAKVSSNGYYYYYGSRSLNAYVERFDDNGNLVWAKAYNIDNSNVEINGIIEANGKLFCHFESKNNTNYIAGVIALDFEGQYFWCKTFFKLSNHPHPIQNQNSRTFLSNINLINQNIILGVRDYDSDNDSVDLYFYKISFDGAVLLQKTINDVSLQSSSFYKLDSNLIVTYNNGSFIKLDENFNVIASKKINYGSSGVTSFRILGISENSSNGYFFVNGALRKNNSNQFFFAKINVITFQVQKLIYSPVRLSNNLPHFKKKIHGHYLSFLYLHAMKYIT
ncbi:hypothetical protein K8089_08430, partial [Aequorivita sp. F47161]